MKSVGVFDLMPQDKAADYCMIQQSELAGEDLVRVGWVDAITDLLNFLHTILVVDFNVGLSASNDEASAIQSVVNSVILVSFVEHDVLNLVALTLVMARS